MDDRTYTPPTPRWRRWRNAHVICVRGTLSCISGVSSHRQTSSAGHAGSVPRPQTGAMPPVIPVILNEGRRKAADQPNPGGSRDVRFSAAS